MWAEPLAAGSILDRAAFFGRQSHYHIQPPG
jgi:hypothetical protein